jgi:mono/diheme cytochrome c family protein
MNDTLFYVFGIGLVVLAVAVSALGLSNDRFPPSKAVMALGLAIVVAVVGATAAFGWLNAKDEQDHRDAEQAAGELPTPAEAVAASASGESVQQEEQGAGQATTSTTTGETPPATGGTTTTTTTAASADGAKVFEANGCSSCHTLQAANATGAVGPNLDTALKGKPASFIKTSIVDPNADITKGYPPDVMPQNFGQVLSPDELNALVEYLETSVNK